MLSNDPALGVYLVALLLLPWRWLSPLGSINSRAGASDLFIALAALTWLVTRRRALGRTRPTPAHIALAAYVGWAVVSAAVSSNHRTSAEGLLVILDVVALCVMTWDFASGRLGRELIVKVVAIDVVVVAVTVFVALVLFYSGVRSGLLDSYGALNPSSSYARVRAGFYSGPLLGSFCIFAWATLAWGAEWFRPRTWLVLQALVVLVALSTISRGAIALLVAMTVRACWRRRPRLAVVPFVAGVLVVSLLSVGQLHIDPSRPWDAHYELRDSWRRHEGAVALRKVGDRPLTGLGPGALPGELMGHLRKAHMTAINVVATLGIPALLALVALLLVLWRRRAPTATAIWAGLAGLAIDAIGQDVENFRHTWALIGLAAAAGTLAVVQREPERRPH
jgi:hypothetical protein